MDGSSHFLDSDRMDQVSDRGTCFPEDINKMEEQKQSYIGISDTSHCGATSNEIHNQSVAKLYVNSVEGGAELINCNTNIRLTPENDDNNGINEMLDESTRTYQRKKRRKMTELSDLPTTDLRFVRQEACSSSLGMDQSGGSTSLDQPVEFEAATPCCSGNINDERVIAGDEISVEVDEKKSLDEALAFSEKTSSGNYDEVLIGKSNEISKNHDIDMLASNNMKEPHDEAKETVSKVEVHNMEFGEENIGKVHYLDSGESLSGDASMYHEEQSVAAVADFSLKLLDDSKGVASQVVHNESINVAVDRTSTGYKGKKLLVLDVNGLLVHISPYIPYDYDPDDIILKKAVFKRPHCDDFLKFCFERFNVGVWTSRTKSNIEPILDFLLGNDKHKLLFCWDQSHCTNTGFTTVEKRHKPLIMKKLKKLWNKCDPNLPWEMGVYNESNTLLLDDTPYKALSNPRYTAVFPYTYHFKDVGDNSLGPEGDLRVYLEGLAVADDVQEYVKQNPFGQRTITEKNLSWGYYRKVIEASSTPPRETEEDDS